MNKDPICGNCGKVLSEHYHEDKIYCFENTNGDIFTDEPDDMEIINFIKENNEDLYNMLVEEWKKYAGHKK